MSSIRFIPRKPASVSLLRPVYPPFHTSRTLATLAVRGQVTTDPEELRRHTFTRWVCDEDIQTSSRYIPFDPHALADVASNTIGVECLKVDKVAEGWNKVFLLTFADGRELIARLPCPVVGPAHLVTASEVATMDFVRNVLDIPAPLVYAWSSRAGSTPVGAEFIIMEKMTGVELHEAWPTLDAAVQARIVVQVARMQHRSLAMALTHHGSLYFKDDVQNHPHTNSVFARWWKVGRSARSKYAIGPSVSWGLWRGPRMNLDIDRGPWTGALFFMLGHINCHRARLAKFAKLRKRSDVAFLDAADASPQNHIAALDQLLSCIPHVLPSPELCVPVIWHPDLHQHNIFVEPTTGDITGIIDWQWTEIAPLYCQAPFPLLLDTRSTMDDKTRDIIRNAARKPQELRRMQLQEEERERNTVELIDVYRSVAQTSRPWAKALVMDWPQLSRLSLLIAARTWHAGLVHTQSFLLQILAKWNLNTSANGPLCPIRVSDIPDGLRGLMERTQLQEQHEARASDLRLSLGLMDNEGQVSPENWEAARAQTRETARARVEFEQSKDNKLGTRFPFQSGCRKEIEA